MTLLPGVIALALLALLASICPAYSFAQFYLYLSSSHLQVWALVFSTSLPNSGFYVRIYCLSTWTLFVFSDFGLWHCHHRWPRGDCFHFTPQCSLRCLFHFLRLWPLSISAAPVSRRFVFSIRCFYNLDMGSERQASSLSLACLFTSLRHVS